MNKLHPVARARLARWLLVFLVLAASTATVVWWRDNLPGKNNPASSSYQTTTSTPASDNQSKAGFSKNQYSVNDPASPWVVVNKGRVLPSSYVPANLAEPKIALNEAASSENMLLRQVPAAAIEKLVSAADNDGMKLMLVSGYRSYSTQQSVYSGYVSSQGKDYANATSAQPGHSEHQTGLAADIGATSRKCQLDVCFGDTAEGKWLAANAYKYGFIVRYQKDKSNLTGYAYEPWHVRYVGNDLAAEINKTGQTLEQFFGLPAYPDYPVKPYELKSGT
jgi:D-alanyl-D-alanine carboxypeptidase